MLICVKGTLSSTNQIFTTSILIKSECMKGKVGTRSMSLVLDFIAIKDKLIDDLEKITILLDKCDVIC